MLNSRIACNLSKCFNLECLDFHFTRKVMNKFAKGINNMDYQFKFPFFKVPSQKTKEELET